MIPPVPFVLRIVIALTLKTLIFLIEVVAILLDAFSGWMVPELSQKTSGRSEVSSQGPKP